MAWPQWWWRAGSTRSIAKRCRGILPDGIPEVDRRTPADVRVRRRAMAERSDFRNPARPGWQAGSRRTRTAHAGRQAGHLRPLATAWTLCGQYRGEPETG